ncbi:MAG: PH domain-containing protein [Verrucomicrobiota bacterium]|nr:PH domain-containing protein [Verrucomicrobiota bacterium]
MDIFIYLNGETRGPFSRERIGQLLEEGLVRPTDLAAGGRNEEHKPLSLLLQQPAPAPVNNRPIASPFAVPARDKELPRIPTETLGAYSRVTLGPNETAYLRTSLHWIIFARFAVLGLVLFLFLALPFAVAVQALTGSELAWFLLPFPAFAMVPPAIAYAGSELVITNMRVLIKTGVIRRQTLEMFISKIESIAVDQGFLGRMFDYGTVTIRGTGGFQEPFESIARPIEFRNAVQRLQSSYSPASTRTA